jgi:hypothetical protein
VNGRLPIYRPRRWVLALTLVIAVVGLGLSVLRMVRTPEVGLRTYLVAFSYWLGIALGALILLMIFHASHAKWPVVVRRVLEVMAASLAIFPLLFVPIALGLQRLYPWAAPDGLDAELKELVHHRAPFYTPAFFILRASLYFVIWILIARVLLWWSTRQDTGLWPQLTARAWKLGAGGLPLVGFALTFASIDWLMTLQVRWASSMWGVYYFAGGFVAAIALLIVIVAAAHSGHALGDLVRPAHFLSLGKLLLAFVCFWAYIAFSQYMLVWIANLPDENGFILLRLRGPFRAIGIALALGHFALPFALLLSRERKANPTALAIIAVQILVMHALDLVWVVMPALDWSLLSSLLGVGALAFAYGLLLMRGRHAVPIGDPFLKASLEYSRT